MAKKAAQAIPNDLLRRARLERGWTQKTVAERIGAPNDIMVTRWERGLAFPSAYYVERLCQLFEQKASDLGLLKEPVATSPAALFPSPQPSPLSTARPRLPIAASPPWPRPVPLLSRLPLIGRETSVDQLHAIYHVVAQGQMHAVLLQGAAGIGKTHLASSFLSWASTQGALLLQGRAFEMGGRLPYQPLVHALSRHLEAEAAPEVRLGTTWLSELSRMFPDLRERYPHLPVSPGDETTARIRLFEAVTRLLQAFCTQGPVVLFIDDIQWADAASLDLLYYAGQRWNEQGTPVLLLLAARSEALARPGGLRVWLTGLHHDVPVTELVLEPLTRDEIVQLLAALGAEHARSSESLERVSELGAWLFRETQGQPFYLVETLRVLLERQILTRHPATGGAEETLDLASLTVEHLPSVLAPNVRRLILSQLEHLPPTGRALVRASAMWGQRATFEMLCRVADLPEEQALGALDEVLGQGLLREASDKDGQGNPLFGGSYLFGHDKVREVIATEMGEAQRRLFHRRVLTVCEALARPAAERAHHALEAGLLEQTVHFSLEAGEEAERLLANAEASLHYTRTLEALAQLPETRDTQRLRVETILKLVQVSFMAVDVEHTLRRLAEAERLAQGSLDRGQLALVHYWIAYLHGASSAMLPALAHAQRVLEEARELKDEELVARASVLVSRILLHQGNYGPIEGLLTPVLPVLEQRERWLDWTYALGYLGGALAARGQYAAGRALGQRAQEQARRAGDMKSRRGLVSHLYLSYICLHGGDPAQMLRQSRQAVEGAELLGDWVFVYIGSGFCGWAQSRLSQYQEGIQSMQRAQATSQRLGGHLLFQDTFAAVSAELLLAAGQVEEALTRIEVVVEEAREVGGMLSAGLAQRVWGQALARLEHREEAEAHLAESWQILLSGEALLEAARTQVAWGLLCRNHGDLSSAQRHFLEAAAQFETSGLTKELEIVQSYLAQMGSS